MPASSISSLNSWGIYLVAAAALLLGLSPVLAATVADSREGVDYRNTDAVKAVLDALQPGVRAQLSLDPEVYADQIRLGGKAVVCDYPGGTISFSTRWDLSNATLSPSARYEVWLQGGVVQVERDG